MIFVAGASFGVVLGKIIGQFKYVSIFLIVLSLTMIPFIVLAETYKNKIKNYDNACKNFNYHSLEIAPGLVVILTVVVVVVRGYMGYVIPTSWNKTIFQTILLYFAMGLGKALGGIMADAIGLRKTAFISIVLALPFLLVGNNNMFISLIGVMMFSMTMAITLGVLVSVLKETPGLSFGLTTIGLFLGTVPIFLVKK